MTLRPGPLRAAAALAAGFIAVRVVYRVLFHGADGAGVVLLDLPAVRMPPPLGHVELLGPVTTGGLWAAVLSAVTIAAVILAFGLLNALVDLPRVLARGARSGPFRGIARALSVAWATLPALVDAVRAARLAQRLRGERGVVRLLAPVLERTLERATAVAAALELRGYAGRALEGDCARPAEASDLRLGFGDRIALGVDALSLRPGELVVVAGDTGAGKSTLLRALSGLHVHVDGGTASGLLRVVGHDRAAAPPRDTSRTVGVVLQHPREAFATERVADEIALALELRGAAPVVRDARVREIADRVGISGLLDRRVRELSAGEATLVALAAAVAEQPVLLLVDEPLADLDVDSRGRIVTLLAALAHDAGMCVVVAEHRVDAFAAVADRTLGIAGGTVAEEDGAGRPGTSPDTVAAPRAERATSTVERRDLPRDARVVLAVDAVTVRHGDRVAVDAASLALHAGERVALVGPNGAGKSSLLVALATGNAGRHRARRGGNRAVALVPHASDDLFVRDTVAAECRRADRTARVAAGTTAARFAAFVGATGTHADRLRSRHPRDLSAGERRCLAIALQTARRPAALLIDEPTRGLDPAARALVTAALVALSDEGAATLFATHDASFAAALADRALAMRAGVLTPVGTDDGWRGEPAPAAEPVAASRHPSPPRDDAAPPAGPAPAPTASRGTPALRRPTLRRTAVLVAANLAALAAFLWPLAASAVPAQAQAAVPYIALALAPLAVVLVLAALDASVRSAHTLALLAVLAAIGAAVRIASTGVGGVEALFVLLILAGRAFGPRFGLLLGAGAIALSALMWGGVGPWLPFQMFACGWVGAGAGLLPRRMRGWGEIGMLCAYGIVSSYVFGLIMNMWFWPFAVGGQTSISYVPGGSVGENLGNFLVYSLVTSTLTWDTLRAVTTVIGVVVVGRAVLSSLRRAKPVAAPPHPAAAPAPATFAAAVDRSGG